MPLDWSPSNMATRTLISHILDAAYIAPNVKKHKCTATCGRVYQMLIGPVGNCKQIGFRSAVSVEVVDIVDDFELLLDACLGRVQGLTKIKSIGLRFVPCIKTLEVLETVINIE